MAPDVGFSIPSIPAAESAMQQSQIITNMFESSELTKTSRPLNNSLSLPLGSSSSTESRRELEAITRKNQISRGGVLPPVPELSTPTSDIPVENPMTQSRLFQEFSNRQRIGLPQASSNNSMQSMPPPTMAMPQLQQMPQQQIGRLSYDPPMPSMPPQMPPQMLSDPYQMQYGPQQQQIQSRPVSTIMPAMPSNPYDPMSRPQSMIGGGNNSYNQAYPPPPPQQPPSMNSMGPSSSSNSSLPVHFIPLCRYEDSQAIRAVSFHPSGN
uniref:Uncharacterized protein n=1 Tax=Panagrolaimus sp. ES5 TaxID=591445 RepID=A0AC34GF04_9BILA